jgi:shikimate kinase
MLNSQTIYIIGFMGSGKSTTGKKLASILDWTFIDLDRKIEEVTGKTIPELFATSGEIYFRNQETEILRELGAQAKTVISTGGGAPCHSENMDFMLKSGLTIYLKLTPGQLRSRLAESKHERPLIKGLTYEGLLTFIEGRIVIREKWYNQADVTIEGIDLDINYLNSIVRPLLNV